MDAASNAEARKPLSELLREGAAPQEWVDAARAWENSTHGPSRLWTMIRFGRDSHDQDATYKRLRAKWGEDFDHRNDLMLLWCALHPVTHAALDHVRVPDESGDHYRKAGRLLRFEPGFPEWLYSQAAKIRSHKRLTEDPHALAQWSAAAVHFMPYHGSRSNAHLSVSPEEAVDNLGLNELGAIEIASRAVKNIGQAIGAGATAPVDSEGLA